MSTKGHSRSRILVSVERRRWQVVTQIMSLASLLIGAPVSGLLQSEHHRSRVREQSSSRFIYLYRQRHDIYAAQRHICVILIYAAHVDCCMTLLFIADSVTFHGDQNVI